MAEAGCPGRLTLLYQGKTLKEPRKLIHRGAFQPGLVAPKKASYGRNAIRGLPERRQLGQGSK